MSEILSLDIRKKREREREIERFVSIEPGEALIFFCFQGIHRLHRREGSGASSHIFRARGGAGARPRGSGCQAAQGKQRPMMD